MSLGTVTFSIAREPGVLADRPAFVHLRPSAPLARIFDGQTSRLFDQAVTLRLVGGTATSLVQATDDLAVSPLGWQWIASFEIPGTLIPDAPFLLPTGEIVDLADLVDLALPPAVVKVVSDADRRAAEAAAARAAEIVAGFDPGAEVGDLPDLTLYFENGMA